MEEEMNKMDKQDEIIANQKVIAKAMVLLIWKNWPSNPTIATSEMFKDLRKLAETNEFSKKQPSYGSQK